MNKKIGIYIHFPFCAKKCPYCDFYSNSYNKDKAASYTDRLCSDIKAWENKGAVADTLYFGGGTPSLLTKEQLALLISTAKKSFRLDSTAEISLEANPNTLNEKRLAELHCAGINRLSIGVQSFNDIELSALGRLHSAKKAEEVLLLAGKTGFKSVSADIMLGTPYQTSKTLEATIKLLTSLPIDHVSAYMLTVEEQTQYYQSELLSHCAPPDELADMYLQTVTALEKNGLVQYEISNLAKPGHESRHNLKYWRGEEYLGFGASAHSYFNGKRFCLLPDLDEYIKNGSANPVITEINPGDSFEWLMLKLRLCEGVEKSELSARFFDTRFYEKLNRFLKGGLLESFENDKRIKLTKKGMLVSNSVICELLE